MKRTIDRRFWDKVSVDNITGCWLWTGYCDEQGYGQFWTGKVLILAHHYLYDLIHYLGKFPRDLELDHLCRNPSCVNPLHLEAVTHQENIRRGKPTGFASGIAGRAAGKKRKEKKNA